MVFGNRASPASAGSLSALASGCCRRWMRQRTYPGYVRSQPSRRCGGCGRSSTPTHQDRCTGARPVRCPHPQTSVPPLLRCGWPPHKGTSADEFATSIKLDLTFAVIRPSSITSPIFRWAKMDVPLTSTSAQRVRRVPGHLRLIRLRPIAVPPSVIMILRRCLTFYALFYVELGWIA
jgi:hypothetical protein